MDISGKLVLVTGGTDGIGREIALQMQAKGAQVIVCGRRTELLEAARADGLEPIAADLSNAAGCEALAKALAGRPLLLVPESGESLRRASSISHLSGRLGASHG